MDILENKNIEKKPAEEKMDLELGKISVSKDVVAIIVAMEAIKVKGVVGLTSGRKGLAAPILDKNNLTKGIDVVMTQNQKEVALTVSLVADYSVGIYQTAREVQKNIKKAVETMAGLVVSKVDINVLDVKFKEVPEKEKKEEDTKKEKPVEVKEKTPAKKDDK